MVREGSEGLEPALDSVSGTSFVHQRCIFYTLRKGSRKGQWLGAPREKVLARASCCSLASQECLGGTRQASGPRLALACQSAPSGRHLWAGFSAERPPHLVQGVRGADVCQTL